MEIIIKVDDKKKIEVIVDNKTTGQLCFGEMLEQVVSLVQEAVNGFSIRRYPMHAPAAWRRHDREREKRFSEVALQSPAQE